MKAIVDLSRCQGHARCYGVDPELFQLDDIGYAVRSEFEVAAGEEENARLGVAVCPERAITLQ